MSRIKIAALLLALAGASAAIAQDDTPPAPPCGDEAHRHFDFWIGDWKVETGDGQPAGTNRIEKILNDCVLAESWQGASGSVGKSFSMYYAADGTWRQTWVDGAGSRLDLSGGLDGSDMVMRGETPAADGGTARHEIRWSPLEDGRVSQHWRVSTDGGKTWQDAFLGFYSRR